MFYSHTYLARKSPLGTVWLAAHIQYKLKKSHYTSTNVLSTADHIMNPEAPMALRMSAYLLLGIVRIYSKQVEYLQHDCYDVLLVLHRVRPSLKFNVLDPNSPDPITSVALPKQFKLDQVPFDETSLSSEDNDRHVKPTKDITIPDPYSSVPEPMDQEIEPDPLLEERLNNDIYRSPHDVPEDDHHSKSTEDVTNFNKVHEDASEQSVPMDEDSPARFVVEENIEIEIMRDAPHDTVRGPGASIIDDFMGERIEPDGGLEQLYNSDASKSSNNIPPHDHLESPSASSVDFALRSHGRVTPFSPSQANPARKSPEMVLLDSPKGPGVDANEHPPTPQVVQHIVRQRKRKFQIYDEATVFTNEEMKESLRDASKLLRKKRLRRIDSLGVWKQQIRLKKDAVFSEPVITGLTTDLGTVSIPTQIHSNPPSSPSNENPEVVPESPERMVDSNAGPESPVRVVDDDMEIEHPCNIEDPDNADNLLSKLLMPSPERKMCNSNTSTPTSMDTSYSEPFGTTNTTDVDTTPELTGSTADPGTSTGLREGRFGQYSPLSDIPESAESPRHLDFLEIDDNTSSGTPASIRVGEKEVLQFHTLPATTRAVGQYIKRQSTGTPNSENSTQTLKLESILENKTKKICARMFFETLVLKSYEFIDVQQEEPYGEINLIVTSKLKEQCSA